jgi:hypothetical protein
MKIFIKQSQLFPSFHTIHNDLELEQIELDNSTAQRHAFAFYSAPSRGGHPLQYLPPCQLEQESSCPPMVPPSPATIPNNGGKRKAKGKGRRKARTMVPVALVTTVRASWCSTPSIIPRPAPSRCGQGCILHSSSRREHHNTTCLLHRRTTAPSAMPLSCPCQRLHCTSSRPRLLPGRHDLDSPDGHRLGRRLCHLQPHHLGCR